MSPAFLALTTAPRAARFVRLVARGAAPSSLNVALRQTAGLHRRFGTLLTAGVVGGTILDRWE